MRSIICQPVRLTNRVVALAVRKSLSSHLRDVRLWHKADIPTALTNVRYGGKTDMTRGRHMSAYDPKRTLLPMFNKNAASSRVS